MAPNNSLIIDAASYGDVVHRDAYIRDKIQASTGTISSYYYLVDGSNKTVPVLEQFNTLGDGLGKFSLYTAGSSVGVNTASDAMLTVTVAETDINSTIVNFAGTSVNLSNPNAMFANLGSASTAGSTHLAGSFTVDAKNAGGADNTVSIGAVTDFNNTVNINSSTLNATGGTSNLGTVNIDNTLTAKSDVSFTGTSSTFSNAGSTTLSGSATLHDALTLDNASSSLTVAGPTVLQGTLGVSSTTTISGSTLLHDSLTLDNASSPLTVAGPTNLQGTLGVSSTATLSGDLALIGASSSFTNAGTTTLSGSATLHDALTLDNASSSLTVAGPTVLQGTLGVSSTTTISGTTTLHSSLTLDSASSPLTVAGPTVLQGTLGVSSTVTLNGDVAFVGTASSFTNAGTTTLSGTTTLHESLTLDNAASPLTVAGPTILQGTLGVSSSLTADGSVSFVGTGSPFIVNGPTTINNSLDVTGTLNFSGSLGMEGDLDMKTNKIINVSSLKNTDNLHIDINSTLGEIDTYVGTGAQPIMSITSSGINVNGDITVLGQTFELQSTTVKVQDLNISLGYLADTLALCDGAGFTIGDNTKSYTLPSFTYQASTNSFISNVDVRSVNGSDNTYCTVGSGVVKAFNSGGTKYAALEYDCVKFTDTWRMRYDDVNDCVKLEKYNGVDTWVTKFTFTS